MHPAVEVKLAELADLCRRYQVRRLEIFGSAASGRFDPHTSDLDFLVQFQPGLTSGHAERYFGLLETLQALFQRPVDLVELGAIRNPYFLRGVEASRRVLYETRNQEIPL